MQVLENDTVDTLAARVQEAEREAYPQAIQLFAEGRLKIDERRSTLKEFLLITTIGSYPTSLPHSLEHV